MIQPQPHIKQIDQLAKQKIREHYDQSSGDRKRFRAKNRYYYSDLVRYLQFLIPRQQKVLEVGCADGYVLQQLEPSTGVGVDISDKMIEAAKARAGEKNLSHLQFHQADIEAVTFTEQFDYVVMSDLLGNLVDIQQALDNVRSACSDETRIVIHYHNILWDPILRAGEKIGLKMPQLRQNWLSRGDIDHFLTLSDFEIVKFERRILMPKYLPLVSWLINYCVAPMPYINALCMTNFCVLRKRPRQAASEYSTTILIPCRNEKGNIRPAVERIPQFGGEQEIMFVDGHSTDGTPQEIEQIVAEFADKDIKFFTQPGKGKGDAVRHGFARATKDILMILDADLTVPPEDLPKFYDAIASHKGEFINGTRLVYPMEEQAMRFLNILGNKFFSLVLTWLLNQPLKDTLCGTKVMWRADYERVAAGRSYFGDFDPFGDFDLIFGASKLNLKIVEVPIRYRDRTYGSTNISRFRHGWLLLKMTMFALKKLKLV